MVKVSARGVSIDTEELTRSLQDVREKAREVIIDLVEDELDELLTDLKEGTSNRGRGRRHKAAYDGPFKGAKVVTKREGSHKAIVRVEHKGMRDRNLFDILNDGRDGFSTGANTIKFPVYQETLTKPNSLDINTHVKIKKKWITTDQVDGFKGRNFYGLIVAKIIKNINKVPTIRGRRGRWAVKLRKDDFDIRVKKT